MWNLTVPMTRNKILFTPYQRINKKDLGTVIINYYKYRNT